ncbi:MAG: tetratricopeptide repeat protein [Methylomonas sp.]|jgi:hypothetical protein
MKPRILLALLPLLLFNACAMYPNGEGPTPAPQTQAKKPPKPATQPPAPATVKKPAYGPATFAIDNGETNFKDEATVPGQSVQPSPPIDVQSIPAPPAPQSPATPHIPGAGVETTPPALPVGPQSGVIAPVQPAPPPAPPALNIVTEDAAAPPGTPPAVLALLTEADRSRSSGNLDNAVVVTERALRIDPRNPTLTYKLAQLRLQQSKPQLAEELAGKAALLAGHNHDLKRKSWLLIAEARQRQHNFIAAKEAVSKAESFSGH